ncbi:MAG: phosphopentomutase [Bacillota bacterium]|nr:phosphopentomutase [Bacillota bacterium]
MLKARTVLIVLDSVGAGALPDAGRYGDEGANTLGNLARAVGGLALPNLGRLGLGNILPLLGVEPAARPAAAYGRLAEASAGKDTTTGHWEIAGIILRRPFPVYPNGFPPEVIEAFERAIGRKVLGNRAASGTEIVAELGEEHLRTGRPIVYTSADSVFQVAAHEEVIPVEELYRMCEIAREILVGPHGVGRVIARPFAGRPGTFQRTPRRRDFSLPPPEPTLLDRLSGAGIPVTGIGKIEDIFAGRGLTQAIHTRNNQEGMEETRRWLEEGEGLAFTNLVDYDMVYGHRNDVRGYAEALAAFDAFLPRLLAGLREQDLLLITADHGCDPTTPGTDHTREYVPLLAVGPQVQGGVNLGTRSTFADLGATVAEWLGGPAQPVGTSFAREIRKEAER